MLPRPPSPPLAVMTSSPSFISSASSTFVESLGCIRDVCVEVALPSRCTTVPQGTRKVEGFPLRPWHCAVPPLAPCSARKLRADMRRSDIWSHARTMMLPPLPPLPPSGGPISTRLSRKKQTLPRPPLPAAARMRTWS